MKPDTTHFNLQQGKLGKPFRLTAIVKGKGEKWVNRTEMFDWYYIFKYIDDGSLFALHEDLNGKVIEKLTGSKVYALLGIEL